MTETKTPSSNAQEDVLQFLETLETYSQTTPATNPAAGTQGGTSADTQSVLDFIDQFTQTSVTPAVNASEVNSKAENQSGTSAPSIKQPGHQQQYNSDTQNNSDTQKQGAWSWGGLLATASTAYQTATTVVDTSVKGALATVETVRTNEATKKFEEKVRGMVNKEAIEKIGYDLRSLGLNTLTAVVKSVVPPIFQHEVVEVWLSHDMVGYDGVESLVYGAFMKVMEQVEGCDIEVKRGNESKKRDLDEDLDRDLNVCEGFIEAVGLAKANLEQIIKKHYKPSQMEHEKSKETEQPSQGLLGDTPTICPVFMAIQPTKVIPYAPQTNTETILDSDQYLIYVIILTDPTHHLTFKTFSQALPFNWLDIPYEENEWVEAKMVSSLKLAVQSIAQDYVWNRMAANDGYQSSEEHSNTVP